MGKTKRIVSSSRISYLGDDTAINGIEFDMTPAIGNVVRFALMRDHVRGYQNEFAMEWVYQNPDFGTGDWTGTGYGKRRAGGFFRFNPKGSEKVGYPLVRGWSQPLHFLDNVYQYRFIVKKYDEKQQESQYYKNLLRLEFHRGVTPNPLPETGICVYTRMKGTADWMRIYEGSYSQTVLASTVG